MKYHFDNSSVRLQNHYTHVDFAVAPTVVRLHVSNRVPTPSSIGHLHTVCT